MIFHFPKQPLVPRGRIERRATFHRNITRRGGESADAETLRERSQRGLRKRRDRLPAVTLYQHGSYNRPTDLDALYFRLHARKYRRVPLALFGW